VKIKFNLKKKKMIIYFLIAAIILTGGYFVYARLTKKDNTNKITTAKAERGNIEVSISGSGTIEPNSKYEVTALVKGEVIEAPFEEGDIVKKGNLLYKIDTKDVENNISKSKLDLERSRNTYKQEVENKNKLTVKSPISGTIVNIYGKVGDSVGNNTKMADVVDSSRMILTIPFVSEHTQGIYVGSNAQVTLYASSYTLDGSVSKISSGETVSDAGVPVKTVEIIVNNPGTIKKGDKATAMVGNASCHDAGTFDYNSSATIISETSGKISNMDYLVGDKISKGGTFATLSSDSISTSYENQVLAIKSAELSLSGQYDQLDNYNITSPIEGTVIQKTTKQGDILDTSSSKVVMATIADMSLIKFKMSVDELDISKVELGQEVSVTADSLPGKTFKGYIENKSIIGTSTNGVTTYPITIVVENPDGLIPGMNVNGKVIVDKKENVIKIPVSALKRGNTVVIKSTDGKTDTQSDDKAKEAAVVNPNAGNGSGAANGTRANAGASTANSGKANTNNAVPQGFKTVRVKTGLNDKDYIEITEGISEGDILLIPTTTSTTKTTTNATGMGGMGGGMPPSGGGTYPGGSGGTVRSTSGGVSR